MEYPGRFAFKLYKWPQKMNDMSEYISLSILLTNNCRGLLHSFTMLKSIRRFFFYLSQEAPDNPAPPNQSQMPQAGPMQQPGPGGYIHVPISFQWPGNYSGQSIGMCRTYMLIMYSDMYYCSDGRSWLQPSHVPGISDSC